MNNKKSQNKDGFFFLKRDPKQVRKLRNEILGIWAGICQEFGGKKKTVNFANLQGFVVKNV